MSEKNFQRISLAFSPDTDDAFMVHALRSGAIDTRGYAFDCLAADIQTLNEAAKNAVYDVTAISVAAYPWIARDYLMMPVGASVGDEFGPAIVVKADAETARVEDLKGKRIAIPGRQTTAFLAARGVIGDFKDVPLPFLEIGPAVLRGEVDAGILIHELQLNPDIFGLRRIGDLGRLWHAHFGLPLPLGANAIRRSLGAKVVHEVTSILRASIETGLANRDATLRAALQESNAGLDHADAERYISMYVNTRSLALEADVQRAIGELFQIGSAFGLSPKVALADALYET